MRRTFATGLLLLIAFTFLFSKTVAQSSGSNTAERFRPEKLPDILQPSEYAIGRAKEMGGEVFKLLPLEMNHPVMKGFNSGGSMRSGEQNESFSDWVKSGKGFYYNFANGPHRPPIIKLIYSYGNFTVGDGRNYGFFLDLGPRDLRTIDKSLREAEFFLSYKPPRMEADIKPEKRRLKEIASVGSTLIVDAPVKAGHTYLLRAIIFGWADIAIALHVLDIEPNGSVTIIWKRLAEFEPALALTIPDAEMQKLVDEVLSELGVRDLEIRVKDNVLHFHGSDANFDRVFDRIKVVFSERKIPHPGVGYHKKESGSGLSN